MKSNAPGPSPQSKNPRAPKIILVKRKRITEELVKLAVDNCASAAECARYLGVKYSTFKRHAEKYNYPGTEINYFEYAKSIKSLRKDSMGTIEYKKYAKRVATRGYTPTEQEIIDGKYKLITPYFIRKFLVEKGYLTECCHNCGFNDKRLTDGLTPVVLNFKDGNVLNKRLDNLELLCYNCFFMLGIPVYDYDATKHERKEQIRMGKDTDFAKEEATKIYMNELLEDTKNL